MTYPDDSLTLHTDLYQINMMQVYFNQGIHDKHAIFELYFRKLPFDNGFAVFAGLERIVSYLKYLHFSETDLAYLRQEGYPEDFLAYLRDFKMTLSVRSAREGDLVFANEPLVQIEGPLAQCQLVETALLNIVNFQTLIATKAARIKTVIEDEPLLEFGTRRAQEMDASIWGARASLLSEVLTQRQMCVPANSLAFLSQERMRMPWCRLMVMITRPLKPMHRLTVTVFF